MTRLTVDLSPDADAEITRMSEALEMSRADLFRAALSVIRRMSPNRLNAAEELAVKVDQYLLCQTDANLDEMRFAYVNFRDFTPDIS